MREPGCDDDLDDLGKPVPLGVALDALETYRRLRGIKAEPTPTLTLEIDAANALQRMRDLGERVRVQTASTIAYAGQQLQQSLARYRAERAAAVALDMDTTSIDEVIALAESNINDMRVLWRSLTNRKEQQTDV